MAKLSRIIQNIFGSSAGTNQLAQIGSLAADAPLFTTDPTVMQALTNYLQGWYDCVIGGNSPAIQDMNSLHFLITRQLKYFFQSGLAEWFNTENYFKGSLVQAAGTGRAYASLTDNNSNNATTDLTNWYPMNQPGYHAMVGGSAFPFATHATLAAALADSNVPNVCRILLLDSQNIGTTINVNKSARIEALPGVTYTNSSAGVCFSMNAANAEVRNLRFSGFTTAIQAASGGGGSAWTYGRVLFCNFASCTTDIDTTNCVAGKIAVTLGNIDE